MSDYQKMLAERGLGDALPAPGEEVPLEKFLISSTAVLDVQADPEQIGGWGVYVEGRLVWSTGDFSVWSAAEEMAKKIELWRAAVRDRGTA